MTLLMKMAESMRNNSKCYCVQQVRLRDYFLDHQNKCPIGPDDILNILPIIKHVSMPTPDASKAYQAAQTSVQKGGLVLLQDRHFGGLFWSKIQIRIHVQHLSSWSRLQVCWIRHLSSWRKPSTCMEECVMISSLRPVTATACWPKRPSCRGRQLRYSCNNSQQHEHLSVQFHFGMKITYDLVIYILNIKMGIHDWYIKNTGIIFL